MTKICGIYKITSPSGKIYIGQSVNILNRFYRYKSYHCKMQPYLYNSLVKYGAENHRFEILQECELIQLNDLEKYYIELYSSFDKENGLNLKNGGDGGGKCSKVTIERLRESHKGQKAWNKNIKMSDEQYVKCENTMFKKGSIGLRKGKIVNEETREKMRLKKIGKKLTDEHKRNISEKLKGKTASNKGYRKNRKCEVDGCERIHKGHGFCNIHLRMYKKILLDSGRNNLPEPSKEKVLQLVAELEKFTVIHNKKNLGRLTN